MNIRNKSANFDEFKGFPRDLQDFLTNLKANNNRVWFEENRQYYENFIKTTSKLLVYSMAKRFAEKNLPFVADPKRSIFRIYRDIRFSKNKDPYKTNVGIYFHYGIHNSGKKPINAPGMYFHIDESECFIAAGLHQPMPEQLTAIRSSIYNNWDEFNRIINYSQFISYYPYRFVGDKLKRIPPGYNSNHPAAEYLKLKNFDIYNDLDIKHTYSERLLDILEEYATVAIPFLDFLNEAIISE